MICPVCGCQQRKTDVCVQCHAPLFAKVVKTQDADEAVPVSKPPILQPVAAKTSGPASSRAKESPPPPSKKKPAIEKKASDDVLVTSTQRVEGKRIAKYYGLIHTDVLIDAREPASASSRVEMHRKQIKSGVLEAMRDLRREAVLLKANAVVATTFDYQRIDSKTLLLSVIGTAVFLKDH